MRLKSTFVGSVPKDELDPTQNDDACLRDDERQRWALSDGASESYNSSLWSRILTDQWIGNGLAFSASRLRMAIERYEAECGHADLSWSKQAAYERGSYATFLGLSVRDEERLRIVAVGDTIAVLMDGPRKVRSFPYRHAEDFNQRPMLMSTKPTHNEQFLTRSAARKTRASWQLSQYCDPRVLCMTDALGKWFLSNWATERSAVYALLDIDTADAFTAFVLQARASGAMRRDDTTLLVLDVEG